MVSINRMSGSRKDGPVFLDLEADFEADDRSPRASTPRQGADSCKQGDVGKHGLRRKPKHAGDADLNLGIRKDTPVRTRSAWWI